MSLPYLLMALQAFVVPAFSERPLPPMAEVAGFVEINEILCETPRYAMDYAAAVSQGEASELAKDKVARVAQRQVCGRYIGLALRENASVATSDGIVYHLVAFRFKEDHRVGWLAESSFGPPLDDKDVPL